MSDKKQDKSYDGRLLRRAESRRSDQPTPPVGEAVRSGQFSSFQVELPSRRWFQQAAGDGMIAFPGE